MIIFQILLFSFAGETRGAKPAGRSAGVGGKFGAAERASGSRWQLHVFGNERAGGTHEPQRGPRGAM